MRTTPLSIYSIAAGFLTALLLPPLYGQETKNQITLKPAAPIQYAGTFHPIDGLIKTGADRSSSLGQELIINNYVMSNYFIGWTAWGEDQEVHDLNKFPDRGVTSGVEVVQGLRYAYCSEDTNPNGLTQTIYLYDDSVYCAGPTNWPVADCSYVVNGLPGSPNGHIFCWEISLDLRGVECNLTAGSGHSNGWGQTWNSDVTGARVASGGYGNVDAIEWFDRTAPNANAFQGCYWFTMWAGLALQMWSGPPDTSRYWAESLGATSGAMDNAELRIDAKLEGGSQRTFEVCSFNGDPIDQMVLMYSSNFWGAPYSYWGGTVLVNPSHHFRSQPLPARATLQIPKTNGRWFTQAACFYQGNFVGFTNGLQHDDV